MRGAAGTTGSIIAPMSFSTFFVLLHNVESDDLLHAVSHVADPGRPTLADELMVAPPPEVGIGMVGDWAAIFMPNRFASLLMEDRQLRRMSRRTRVFAAIMQTEPLLAGMYMASGGVVRRRVVFRNGLPVYEVGNPLPGEEECEIPDESLVIELLEAATGIKWRDMERAMLIRILPHAGCTNAEVIEAITLAVEGDE